MNVSGWKYVVAGAALLLPLVVWANANAPTPPVSAGDPAIPPSRDPANIYAEAGLGMLSPAVAGALSRVYVPVVSDNMVYVIDPGTMKVVDRYAVPGNPQHVVPSWDLKTLWVASSQPSRNISAALTPIDPTTGKLGKPIVVRDAYNLYFTQDGSAAIIVAEAMAALEFRDAQTMALQSTLEIPDCSGINHADFSPDGRIAIFTCEFGGGGLVKVDLVARKVIATFKFPRQAMPQDIRSSPDGTVFYVADMLADGLHVIDVAQFKEIAFIPTGIGAHALYPSRDGTKLYVANRGSHSMMGTVRGPGSISVLDFATRAIEANWPIPGGGSPDMGNISTDGKTLWLSGRYDNVVYAIDTTTGAVVTIPVGAEPHGLTVWPQPGRYSLGHTGVMR
jgi:YVTN family beta-propeller protein